MFERLRVLLALRRRRPRWSPSQDSTDPILPPINLPKDHAGRTLNMGRFQFRADRRQPPRARRGADLFDYLLGFVIIGLLSAGGILFTSSSEKTSSSGTGWQFPSPPSWMRGGTPSATDSATRPSWYGKFWGQSPRPRAHRRGADDDLVTPDAPPAPTRIVQATYTDQARNAGFHGKVFVIVVVDELGAPEKIEPTAPIPFGLEQPIGEALFQWRFQPAMLGGEPVPGKTVVEVPFR
jgi:hypothetical protein